MTGLADLLKSSNSIFMGRVRHVIWIGISTFVE